MTDEPEIEENTEQPVAEEIPPPEVNREFRLHELVNAGYINAKQNDPEGLANTSNAGLALDMIECDSYIEELMGDTDQNVFAAEITAILNGIRADPKDTTR